MSVQQFGRPQDAPISCKIDIQFWQTASQIKLDKHKLDTPVETLQGSFSAGSRSRGQGQLLLEKNAFTLGHAVEPGRCKMMGEMLLVNTSEAFKDSARNHPKILSSVYSQLAQAISSPETLHEPHKLNMFFMLVFADLKKYHYNYCMAVPFLAADDFVNILSTPQPAADVLGQDTLVKISGAVMGTESGLGNAFLLHTDGTCAPLHTMTKEFDGYVVMLDTEGAEGCHPTAIGTAHRNLLACLTKQIERHDWKLLAFRDVFLTSEVSSENNAGKRPASMIFNIRTGTVPDLAAPGAFKAG